jgi:hypothetical protein
MQLLTSHITHNQLCVRFHMVLRDLNTYSFWDKHEHDSTTHTSNSRTTTATVRMQDAAPAVASRAPSMAMKQSLNLLRKKNSMNKRYVGLPSPRLRFKGTDERTNDDTNWRLFPIAPMHAPHATFHFPTLYSSAGPATVWLHQPTRKQRLLRARHRLNFKLNKKGVATTPLSLSLSFSPLAPSVNPRRTHLHAHLFSPHLTLLKHS